MKARKPEIKVIMKRSNVNTKTLPFIIDSGATISVLCYHDFLALGRLPVTPLQKETNIIAANRTRL